MRRGGATKWDNRGSETFCAPPSRRCKTFRAPPFKMWKPFVPPPPPPPFSLAKTLCPPFSGKTSLAPPPTSCFDQSLSAIFGHIVISVQVCVANAKKQPEIDMPNARPNAKLRLASGSGIRLKTRQTQFKMGAVEHRRRALALLMMFEVGFFDLQEEKTIAKKKKKRSVWAKPFLLRRLDPACDTMFTIQHEFLAVSANAKSSLLAFLRRK